MNSTIINQRSRRNIAIPLLVAILASLTITRNRTTGKQLHTSIETRKSTFDPTYRYAPTANFTENELFVKSYANLWQTRFESSEARNKSGGYVFFKHMRKAGGTAVREYLSQVFAYHNNSRSCDALLQEDLDDEQFEFYIMERNQSWFKNFGIAKRKEAGPRNRRNSYKVHYVEQEFLPMDWNCPTSDPRWEDSLSIIVLRHPIERHMSEFFYKGPGGDRENGFKLDKQKLYTDEDYSKQLSEFIFKYLPPWMAKKGAGPHRKRDNDFKWFFIGEVYMDNFQLRSLAGCSSGECMKRYHIRKGKLERMEEGFRAATGFYTEPISACTNFFDVMCKPHLDKRLCRNRVDGPCFYPAVAWGDMSEEDLARGIKALEAFDVVLLMEKLNDKDQSSFFADVMGVNHDVTFSFNKMSSDAMNSQVGKESPREVTHFYRDILSRFELLRDVQNLLYEENRLEIALFERAVELNRLMIDRWKTETKWGVSV